MTARRIRTGLAGGALLLVLALPACSDDDGDDVASDPTPSSTTTTTPTTTAPTTSATTPSPTSAPGGVPGDAVCGPTPGAPEGTYSVGEAGTVQIRVEGDTVELVEARPNPGWTATGDTEDDHDEVEVTFRRDGREIEFEAEIDDGRLEVEPCKD